MTSARAGAGPAATTAERWPLLLQAGFVALVGADVAVRAAAGASYPLLSWPALGLALAALATLALGLAWRPVPAAVRGAVLVAVPVVDLAALGLLRLAPDGGGLGPLVVLPAIWLGRRHGRRGAVLAVVATVALVSLPTLAYLGAGTPAAVSRALTLPAVVAVAAFSVALGLEAVRARSREAEERGLMLEATLAELRREARRSATVLDAATAGMVLLDADGTYRAVNRRHQDFLHLAYPTGHLGRAGQEGDVLAADRSTPLTREEMPSWRAARGEEFDDLRIWVGADPSTQRALSVTARALRDADGALEGSVLSYLDVTDLLQALEVKDDFVATVSHELRTPLTSIIGYLDVLQERPDLPDQVRSHLDVVGRNATRLLTLVTDLLHPAAQGPGGLALARLPEELGAVAREAVLAAQPAAHAAGLSIHVEAPAPVPALVDRAQVLDLLGHLLSNAVRFNTPGGTVTVEVGTAPGAGGGSAPDAVVEVRDTGVGIPEAELASVLEPFARGSHARVQAVQGVGLGLTLARSVAQAHGGRLEVASTPGVGTTVRVVLPARGGLDRAGERRLDAPVPG